MSLSSQRMGILNVGQRIEEQAEFEKIYKNGTTLSDELMACVHVVLEWSSLFSVCDL